MKKDVDVLKNDFEKYTGAAIYALVGSDGKRYIGKSVNYLARMREHRYAMNSIARGEYGGEGFKMREAIEKGVTFYAEILEKIPLSKRTPNYMCERESYYYELYGGNLGTHNSTAPITPNPYYKPFDENIYFRFQVNDPEIIDFLDSQENMQELIKKALREYMTRNMTQVL